MAGEHEGGPDETHGDPAEHREPPQVTPQVHHVRSAWVRISLSDAFTLNAEGRVVDWGRLVVECEDPLCPEHHR